MNGKDLMQRSILLPIVIRYLTPLLLIFSVFLLIRGHNEVGGGFAGGLVAASAFMLYAIAYSPESLRGLLPLQPRVLIAIGLFTALLSGSLALFSGKPFMTGLWLADPIPVIGKVGTPLLFDTGVYLLVIGIVLMVLLSIAEE